MTKVFLSFFIVGLSFSIFSCDNQAQTGQDKNTASKQIQPMKNHPSKDDNSTKAPDFELTNSEGETVRLSSFEDKVIILNFWATWCGPCRMEIPGFVDLYKKYNEKGLEIIGVSVDQSGWNAVKPFIKNYKVNYPILMFNNQVIMDYGGIRGIPTTFIINRKGEIVEKIVGLRPDAYFEQRIKEFL